MNLTVELMNVSPLSGSVTLLRIAQMERTRQTLYVVYFLQGGGGLSCLNFAL